MWVFTVSIDVKTLADGDNRLDKLNANEVDLQGDGRLLRTPTA